MFVVLLLLLPLLVLLQRPDQPGHRDKAEPSRPREGIFYGVLRFLDAGLDAAEARADGVGPGLGQNCSMRYLQNSFIYL